MGTTLNFSGHQTFTLRHSWLPKAYDFILKGGDLWDAESAMTELGVGKNMVESIRFWLQATGILERDRKNNCYQLTTLANKIFAPLGRDKYLELTDTLWILHWKLATNKSKASTWYWLFNLCKSMEFEEQSVVRQILEWARQEHPENNAGESTIKRDLSCCLRTYLQPRNYIDEDMLDCPLTELDLIAQYSISSGSKWYRFNTEASNDLPSWVFHLALLDYRQTNNLSLTAIPFHLVASTPGSPGKVFKMQPDAVMSRLQELQEQGCLQIYDSNGLVNIALTDSHLAENPLELLESPVLVA